MRKHDGVDLAMNKAEGAAEHVAELVVQRGPSNGKRLSGEVGSEQRVTSSLEIIRFVENGWQRPRQDPHPFNGIKIADRVGTRCIKRLDAMSDGVETTGPDNFLGQRHRELWIVNYRRVARLEGHVPSACARQ